MITRVHLTIASLFIFFVPLFFGCKQEWNPDQQFEREIQALKNRRDQYQEKRQQEARQNLNKFKAEVLLNVIRKLPVRELDVLLGFKYKILAQRSTGEDFWESRQYFWGDIVESKWGSTSKEYEICQKDDVLMIVSVSAQGVIGVEY